MPELETLLRDVRPAPDPTWAARLDARAAARFPKKPPRWKLALQSLREHLLAVGAVATVATLLVVVVVVAVNRDSVTEMSASTASGTAVTSDTSAELAAPDADTAITEESATGGAAGGGTARHSAPAAAAEDSAAVAPQTLPSTPAPPAISRDRAVISSAELVLSTTPDKVSSVNDRAIRVVDSLGGYVETSSVSSSGRNASATLTVKIPSARLDAGIAQLSRLAHVKSRSQQAQDVTDQRSALEAAVRDARADQAGLRVRLAKAETDKDRARLRALLDRASRRVTRAERRVAALGQEVSFATVALQIDGERKAAPVVPGGRWTPGDAVKDALRVLEVSAGVLVIVLAALIPLALVAILAALAGRVVVHRRREHALESA